MVIFFSPLRTVIEICGKNYLLHLTLLTFNAVSFSSSNMEGDKSNLAKRKLSRDRLRVFNREKKAKLRQENIVPTVFQELLPLDEQPLKAEGGQWTERARYELHYIFVTTDVSCLIHLNCLISLQMVILRSFKYLLKQSQDKKGQKISSCTVF